MDFSEALKLLKAGKRLARKGWWDNGIYVTAQYPDKNSKNTKPYLMMHKKGDKFPLDLSCESIFAEDWEVVE